MISRRSFTLPAFTLPAFTLPAFTLPAFTLPACALAGTAGLLAGCSAASPETAVPTPGQSQPGPAAAPAMAAALADFGAPVVHKGSGAAEVSLDGLAETGPVLLNVKNLQPGQLSVNAVSASGTAPLAANSSGHYDGTVLALQGTTGVKVSAAHGWLVNVMPAKTTRRHLGGTVISGHGDDVIDYRGNLAHATIAGFGGPATVAVQDGPAQPAAAGTAAAGTSAAGTSAALAPEAPRYLVVKAARSWKITLG